MKQDGHVSSTHSARSAKGKAELLHTGSEICTPLSWGRGDKELGSLLTHSTLTFKIFFACAKC